MTADHKVVIVDIISQYQEIVDEIETMGLEDVKSQGIYKSTEENVKKIMNGFLSEFVDYEIIYM